MGRMGRGRRQDGCMNWKSDCSLVFVWGRGHGKNSLFEYIAWYGCWATREVILDLYTLDTLAANLIEACEILNCHCHHGLPHLLDRSKSTSFEPRSLLLDCYLIPKYSDAALVKLRLGNDAHTINSENPEPTRHSSSLFGPWPGTKF